MPDSLKVLMETSCTYNELSYYAHVVIEPGYASGILKSINAFQAIRGYDRALAHWAFFDCTPTFIYECEEVDSWLEHSSSPQYDGMEEALFSSGGLVIVEQDTIPDSIRKVRMDCTQLIISEGKITWETHIKHTKLKLVTSSLPWSLLQHNFDLF